MDQTNATVTIEEPCGAPRTRYFNVRSELSERSIFGFVLPLAHTESGFGKGLGPVGDLLLLMLQQNVPGIESGALTRYMVGLTISPSYSWDEVEPGVLGVFRDLLAVELLCVDRQLIYPSQRLSVASAMEVGRPCWPDYDYLEEDHPQPSHVVVRNYTHPEPPE